MEYKIVNLTEKIIVGIGDKISNSDPKAGEKIGGLWNEIFNEKIYSKIVNLKNEYPICLYSDYTDTSTRGNNLEYDVTIGFEVTKYENPEFIKKTIPAGKYAIFFVKGNVATATMKAWEEIWKMDLPRSYTGDFEIYLNQSMDEAEIEIYIALK